MNDNITKDPVIKTIVQIISDALSVDADGIGPETKLFRELEAESIDVVDVRFRMEQSFGLRIDHRDLFTQLGDGLSNEEIADRFTVEYLAEYVRNRME